MSIVHSHGIPLYVGDTVGLYDELDKRDYFTDYRYPRFPETVVAWKEDLEENAKLYTYQKSVWSVLNWHGGQSKHQTHYTWCLNRSLQCGAKMTVTQYSLDIDRGRKRMRVLSIQACMVNATDIRVIEPYLQRVEWFRRIASLKPMDYELTLSALGERSDLDEYNESRDFSRDRFPAQGDPADPQWPFLQTCENQVLWLHRLCQLSPGALSLRDGFRLYGCGLSQNGLVVVGSQDIPSGCLQLKTVPVDTPILVSDPCRQRYRIDERYVAFGGKRALSDK